MNKDFNTDMDRDIDWDIGMDFVMDMDSVRYHYSLGMDINMVY